MRSKVRFWLLGIPITTALVIGVWVIHHNHRYPYGWSHCCDKQLFFSLQEYADGHNGWFPRGEESPEASLSLIYRQNPELVNLLRGKTVPEEMVRERLESGQLLTPETCGWHYVEGLRNDDNPALALFWDKASLGHNGERIPEGSHIVCFISGTTDIIPGDRWNDFLSEQNRLLPKR